MRVPIILPLFALAILAVPAPSQVLEARQLLVIEQTGAPYSVSRSFTTCPDFDGDGVMDLLMPGTYKGGPSAFDFGLVEVRSGKDGHVVWEVREPVHAGGGDRFGYSITALNDLDGDKKPEILIGAPLRAHGGSLNVGSVFLYSSRTKTVLREHRGTKKGDYLGWTVGVVADLDSDKAADYYIKNKLTGVFNFYSGRTGVLLRSFSFVNYSLGSPLSVPDLDKDGVQDLAFGAISGCCSQGRVLIVSGKSFKLIKTILGHPQGAGFGSGRDLVPDVNGDGVDDLIVSGFHYPNPTYYLNGYARLISLADGKVIREWKSDMKVLDFFGSGVTHAGDLDGDGVADVAIGRSIMNDPVRVLAYSGKTGLLLQTYSGIPGKGVLAWPWNMGDVNSDGVDDLAIGTQINYPGVAGVHIYSGRSIGLDADKPSVSMSKNTSVQFRIDAGPSHKGKYYLLLGSLSGNNPGLQLGVHYLPLAWDPYTVFSLAFANVGLVSRSFFPYTGAGSSKAILTALPGLPASLIGQSFHHAFVIWDPKTGSIDYASNAVKTEFLK